MQFNYNNKNYLLTLNDELHTNRTHSFLSIFEVDEDFNYHFINYFNIYDESDDELIKIAKRYIDRFYQANN